MGQGSLILGKNNNVTMEGTYCINNCKYDKIRIELNEMDNADTCCHSTVNKKISVSYFYGFFFLSIVDVNFDP